MLLKIFAALFAVFLDLKYATTADPDPVILAKAEFGRLERKFFKFLIFEYFLNTIFSRSFFDLTRLFILKKALFLLKYNGFENFITLEKIFLVEHPNFGIAIKT